MFVKPNFAVTPEVNTAYYSRQRKAQKTSLVCLRAFRYAAELDGRASIPIIK